MDQTTLFVASQFSWIWRFMDERNYGNCRAEIKESIGGEINLIKDKPNVEIRHHIVITISLRGDQYWISVKCFLRCYCTNSAIIGKDVLNVPVLAVPVLAEEIENEEKRERYTEMLGKLTRNTSIMMEGMERSQLPGVLLKKPWFKPAQSSSQHS